MNILQKSFDFLINNSVWVAVSAFCLTYITYLNLSITPNQHLLYLVGFGTVVGYNFIKHYQPKAIKIPFNITTLLNAMCLLLSCYFFLHLKLHTQIAIAITAAIIFFYTIPIHKKSLRNLAGLKIYTVALCWTLVTTLLPIIEFELYWNTDVFIEITQRFVFIIAITLPFEIRDLLNDSKNLHTIPQQFGIKKTKLYGYILMVIFLLISFFKDNILKENLIILTIIFLCSLFFILFAKKTQTKYYASFFVEGIPILWLLLLLIL